MENEASSEEKSQAEEPQEELESANFSKDLLESLESRRRNFKFFLEKSKMAIDIKEIDSLLKKPFPNFPKSNKEIMGTYSRYAKRAIEEEK